MKEEPQLEGQMDIFDFLGHEEKERICKYWDKDVSDISDYVNKWCEETNSTISSESFRVWTHVPNLGYRLCIWVEFSEEVEEHNFMELQKEMDSYKNKKVEVSINVVPNGRIMISTLFTDERKRRT